MIVTEEAPPEPKAVESEPKPVANVDHEEKHAAPPTTHEQEVTTESAPAKIETHEETAPAIEPPRPANGGSRYQEYLDQYFNRKTNEPHASATEQESAPAKPVEAPTVPAHVDEPPTLSPAKPAKEYNDPFRPTSYRPSYQRTWRDPSGDHRIKARFLGVDDRGMAQMEREDGRRTRIPLANLSQEDQRFIELLAIRDVPTPPQAIASRPRGR